MVAGIYLQSAVSKSAKARYLRTPAAIHFAGRFRLIDFTLSNLVNSGIYRIGLVLDSNYQTLVDHIGSGKDWDLSRKIGGLTLFPPYLTDETDGNSPIKRAMLHLNGSNTDTVVICDASTYYNMDYRPALSQFYEGKTDVMSIVGSSGISGTVPLHTYIMSKQTALLAMSKLTENSGVDFRQIISQFSIRDYKFDGFWGRISDYYSFYLGNMEMLDSEKRNALFNHGGGQIHTSSRDSLPVRYGRSAKVSNSLIADGCQIDGTLENCVIFRRTQVQKSSIVFNSVLQSDTLVEPDAQLNYVVTDKNVIITYGKKLSGTPEKPLYIEANSVV